MSNSRPEFHVAQQSRREKLRVQQNLNPVFHMQDIPNHLLHLSRECGLNPDLVQVRNVRNCDLECDQHNPSFWKGLGPQQSCDWMVSYVNGSATSACNQSPSYMGGILSGNVNGNTSSSSTLYSKPGCNGFLDVHSSLNKTSSQGNHRQNGEMQFGSPFYQNTLEEVVTSSTIGSQDFELASAVQKNFRETSSWVDRNGLDLLLGYRNQEASLMHRPVDGNHQWNSELGFVANKCADIGTVCSVSTTQGLSLSLSSDGPSKVLGSENLQSPTNIFHCLQDSKANGSSYICSSSRSIIQNRGYGNSIQGIANSSTYACPSSTGPLGPFTGYATILKISKFLRPTQQILDDFCSVTGSILGQTYEITEKRSRDVISSCYNVNAENEVDTRGGSSGVSCSFYSSNEASGEGGIGNQACQSEFRQKKAKLLYMQEEVQTTEESFNHSILDSGRLNRCIENSKRGYRSLGYNILYCLVKCWTQLALISKCSGTHGFVFWTKVCRRYKQFHQQMQLVISSFKSVAGLSAATPYISLVLKTVSRHFRCLKNAISNQLRHINRALGEDLLCPTTGTSSSKGEPTAPWLRIIDQSLQKHKSGGDNLGFLETQQQIWRPQRGLPERSVAILRAWLFEHFLHPYPTDTDKHMLATQTGLSRNQVSNWFINARVRVWKPMVEEIHMLETKGSSGTDLNPNKDDGISDLSSGNGHRGSHPSDELTINTMSEKPTECSGLGAMDNAEDGQSSGRWNQGNWSRMDCQFRTSLDGGLMDFMPYHQSGLEVGGLGAVSLTLGLRHCTESTQQQQLQQEQQRHQPFGHIGGQMIHDFVG